MGLQSLPVAFGVDAAKWICVASIDATQLAVAAYLAFGLHEPVYGAVLLALILPQARRPLCLACRLMPCLAPPLPCPPGCGDVPCLV
jgi:4-hydroxybenzoate polyprenyltransferase